MRRFPPPWSVDELEACFVVTDSAGQKLAYVYYEDEPGRRRIAVNNPDRIPPPGKGYLDAQANSGGNLHRHCDCGSFSGIGRDQASWR
jgi:hypothetical protein